jgi:hypothetical protein
MYIDIRFFRAGGHSTRVYDHVTREPFSLWFSPAWHRALNERLDREIREATRVRLERKPS